MSAHSKPLIFQQWSRQELLAVIEKIYTIQKKADEIICFFCAFTLQKIIQYLNNSYRADLRALALMRMGIALLVLTDLIIRAGDLEAFFTDEGIWPTHLIHNFGWKEGYWSLHALNGSKEFQVTLFILHAVLALFLLAGYRTRSITALLFLFTISLHNRNIYIQQAGDDLLRLVLFWGIFLPWGAALSADAAKNQGHKRFVFPSWSYGGYLLLVASVYFFSALLKSDNEWHNGGDAVYYALSLEQLRLPAGTFIYNYPDALKVATWFVYHFELLFPLILFFPLPRGHQRTVLFVLIVIFHFCIGLTLYVGLFYLISIVSAIGLLPAGAIDFLFRRTKDLRKPSQTPVFNPLLLNCAALFFAGLCLTVNLSTLPWFDYKLRSEFLTGMNLLRLDQYWGMFSPSVLKKDGWLVYHGSDSVGRQWDLRLDQDHVDYSKPESIVSMYGSDRWRKLAENMQDDRFSFLRPLYCQWYLRTWNKKPGSEKMRILNLYFMEKENLPGYKTSEVQKKLFSVCDQQ